MTIGPIGEYDFYSHNRTEAGGFTHGYGGIYDRFEGPSWFERPLLEEFDSLYHWFEWSQQSIYIIELKTCIIDLRDHH